MTNNRRTRIRNAAAVVLIGITAAACTEEAPTATQDARESTEALERSKNVAFVQCVASREQRSVTCGQQDEPATAGNAETPNIILGKQGVYVDVITNNVDYNAGTGDFTFNLAVRNRIPQALGTANGTTLEATGVRVFFNSGPTVTGGTGLITVPTPDGTATFTAANQPYYQYNEVLSQFELSPQKSWKLNMPATVETFVFTLLVNGAVQFPDGYIDLQPTPFSIQSGAQKQMSAAVRNANGELVPGAVVTWSTGDPAVLIVDATGGLTTAVKSGTTTVIATSGTKVGTATFNVTGVQRIWNGSVNTDWDTPGNWDLVGATPTAQYPSATDTAVIPGDKPNYPVFDQNQTVGGVLMQPGTTTQPTVNQSAFDFTLNASIDHGLTGTITGTVGRMIFQGTAQTISGGVSNVDYRHARFFGSYSLNANLNITGGRLVVQGGRLRNALFRVRVRP